MTSEIAVYKEIKRHENSKKNRTFYMIYGNDSQIEELSLEQIVSLRDLLNEFIDDEKKEKGDNNE